MAESAAHHEVKWFYENLTRLRVLAETYDEKRDLPDFDRSEVEFWEKMGENRLLYLVPDEFQSYKKRRDEKRASLEDELSVSH